MATLTETLSERLNAGDCVLFNSIDLNPSLYALSILRGNVASALMPLRDADDDDSMEAALHLDTALDVIDARISQLRTAGPDTVAASSAPPRPSLGTMGAAVRRTKPRKTPDHPGSRGNVRALTASGGEMDPDDLGALTDQFNRALRDSRMPNQDTIPQLVVSYDWSAAFPEDRRLDGDAVQNSAKMDAVVSLPAIAASGGICSPVDVDFSLLVASDDSTPVIDSLPRFNASRGGLRFMSPPTFTGVGSSATGIWTEAIDANPGTQTKPVQTVTCGSEQEVFVDAIPTRLQFGNMSARFYPEMVGAHTALATANAARVRENNVLAKIAASSTTVSSGKLLGATRDLLATLDLVCAAYRYRSRTPDSIQLRVVLPRWTRDLVRADLARSMSHGEDASLVLSDGQVAEYFAARGVQPVFHYDGETGATHNGVPFNTQGWAAQTTQALEDWPLTVQMFVYCEGTFQYLDGGRLDIAVVRDSTLDSTNSYQQFLEQFETVAYRGFESLEVIATVRPSGASGATVSTSSY